MKLSTLFGFGRPPKTIVNAFSSGGFSAVANPGGGAGKSILSGALTAGTLKNLLTVTGSGVAKFTSAFTNDTTSRTVRLKVTIDGTVVFDSTTNAITSTNFGNVAIGIVTGSSNGWVAVLTRIPFNSSFAVDVASSLTETDKVSINADYETN